MINVFKFEIVKSIKGFSGFDLVTTLASLATVAAIAAPLAYRSIESNRIESARLEIVKIAQANVISNEGRSVAGSKQEISQGETLDPWGHVYQKEIIKNSYGQATHLVVWSYGPNGVFDTGQILPSKSSGLLAVVFQGDDIGYVIQIK